MWVEYGQGQFIRRLPLHNMEVHLGPETSIGKLFFHAFAGCDVLSAFPDKGKKTA